MKNRPCSYHQTVGGKPEKGCAVCTRLGIERRVVRRVVSDLLNAGYVLNVSYGEGPELDSYTGNARTILAALQECDEEVLLAVPAPETPDLPHGWVLFVYGNDGYDVIADHTVNLSPVLDPVCEWASNGLK